MLIERRGFSPLAGGLPSIAVRLPSTLPVAGSATFTAPDTSTETSGACRRVAAVGSFRGTLRTRFTGWGARTSTFGAAGYARYTEDR